MPLLEEMYRQGIWREDIANILELYKPYQNAVGQIPRKYFDENKPKLTDRETEIARLAAEGLSNKKIAEKLFVSQNTVKTQLKCVFEKLGVNSCSLLKQSLD
jgi:Response regulator containing a CheY-like receiver domain and an HTH DNA-binding domain